ncbi:MAG: isocitrate lyase/PEP mutase family protein [Actinomycetes bacterium]
MRDLAAQAEELRARHFGEAPLVLANVWDAASARAVAAAGHPVIATSSAAVAASLGRADHEQMDTDEAFGVLRRIAEAVSVPVTADIEAGYGLPPAEIAQRLLEAGAVGCNLEDSDHRGECLLLDADLQAERIHALCESAHALGVDLVVNARVDVYLRQATPPHQRTEEAIRRARTYLEAGATCVYPIGLTDQDEIALLVQELAAPINIWLRADTPPLARLGQLGVARVSAAGGLHRAAMDHTTAITAAILGGDLTGLLANRPTTG